MSEHPAASSQVERDVVTVRSAIDYPDRNSYIKALEALDRLAAKAHEADALTALLNQPALVADIVDGDNVPEPPDA